MHDRHMSEHQKQTAFFKQIFRTADTPERRQLKERILKAEGDVCCCRRAMLRIAGLIAISMLGCLYTIVMVPEVALNQAHVLRKVFQVMAIGSLMSLLAYTGCWLYYRAVLFQVHTECRRFLMSMVGASDDREQDSEAEAAAFSGQALRA